MPLYTCTTGGLTVNGKKYKAGHVYSFPKNPAEEHFVLLAESDGKSYPKIGQEVHMPFKMATTAKKTTRKKKE